MGILFKIDNKQRATAINMLMMMTKMTWYDIIFDNYNRCI